MLAPLTALQDIIEFPKIPAHVELPQNLVLRFAEDKDIPRIQHFLRLHKQSISMTEEAVEKGRLIIFCNPDDKKICGVAYARKIASRVKIETPTLSLPWVALSQIMIAALISNEIIRNNGVLFDMYRDQLAFLNHPEDAKTYLERAANIHRVISGTSKMKLHLSPALEEIEQIEMIRHSIFQRCGRA